MLFYLNHLKNLKILLILKMTEKSTDAYKTIGEVVKLLDLKSRNGTKRLPPIRLGFGKKNLNKSNPKF
jgi:hypothetical protein